MLLVATLYFPSIFCEICLIEATWNYQEKVIVLKDGIETIKGTFQLITQTSGNWSTFGKKKKSRYVRVLILQHQRDYLLQPPRKH